MDKKKIEKAITEILQAIGDNPKRKDLRATPTRVAEMYEEIFAGINKDPAKELEVVLEQKHHEIILLKDIPLYSVCEHHLLPFLGRAHIAYIPKQGRVTGLSKLARVVDEVSRRPQVQERMTETIANMVEEALGARGVAVMIESTHSCMTMRGIRKAGASCTTSAMRGIFRENLSSRAEILGLIMNPGR